MNHRFEISLAAVSDLDAIKHLMNLAIQKLQKGFLSPAQITASAQFMGLDTQLIDDGTYLCIWEKSQPNDLPKLVGCGGWSARSTLYGGNHSPGRSADFLDPSKDAGRIRAMYTHPDHARQGIGSLIIREAEKRILKSGFWRAEMMATLSGVPLYEKHGYIEIERHTDMASDGTPVPLIMMGKNL